MIKIDRYEVLTFDCYGTLIDWESGILGALGPVLSAHRVTLDSDEVLRLYAEMEAKAEEGPYVKYRKVLRRVVRQLGDALGFEPSATELDCLAESLGRWPPFADTGEALRRLHKHCRLAIISNVDDDLFALTARLVGVQFDWVVTAEQARSYKPSLDNFRTAMKTMGVSSDKVLHVAQSLRHDIAPAKALGLTTVWVNRTKGSRRSATASGAASPGAIKADLEVPDLNTLADLIAPEPYALERSTA